MWRVMIAILWGMVSVAVAGDLPTADPADVGLSAEGLADVDAAMQEFVDDEKAAGILVMVARRGRIAHVQTFGQMDIEAEKPMRRDAILRFYSMTKPITSAALLTLYEEGKFELDDPVAKYLPELTGVKVYAGKEDGELRLVDAERPPTIRDLMCHTAGLTYGFLGGTPVSGMYNDVQLMDRNSSLSAMIDKLADLPLAYQPGERFHYSIAVDVQGRLIEVLSGMSLDAFFQERIFEPLGMVDTGFYVPSDKLERFAANYGPRRGGGLQVIDAPQDSAYLSPPGLFSGGGGLVSTADDYMRFAQMLLNRGELDGARILKPETVDLMTRNHLPEKLIPIRLSIRQMDHTGFGLGLSVRVDRDDDEPAGVVGEYGWGGAASTFFSVAPKEELIGLVLTQYMPLRIDLAEAFRVKLYDAMAESLTGD